MGHFVVLDILGITMAQDVSTSADIYRFFLSIIPPVLFYPVVIYLLLGRLPWFRKQS